MRRLRALGIVLATVWLIGATVLAIWPVVAHAPWEETKLVEVEKVVTFGETGEEEAAFSYTDVLSLAQTQVATRGAFPSGTRWVRCTEASYRSANRMWVVSCSFYVDRDATDPAQTRTYTFDDRTGLLPR